VANSALLGGEGGILLTSTADKNCSPMAPPRALQPPPPSLVSSSPQHSNPDDNLFEQVCTLLPAAKHEQLEQLSFDTTSARPLLFQDQPATMPTKEPPTAKKTSALATTVEAPEATVAAGLLKAAPTTAPQQAPVPKIKSWGRSMSSSRHAMRSKHTVIGATRRIGQSSSCPGASVTLTLLASSDKAAAGGHKAVPEVCRMDLDDDAAARRKDVTESTAARNSSLSKAYDALGAEFHCLDTEDSAVDRAGWRASSRTEVHRGGHCPGSIGQPAAMALDLGFKCSPSGSFRLAGSRTSGRPSLLKPEWSASLSGFHSDTSPTSPSSPVSLCGRSSVVKRSQHTCLPELPRSSSGSIAWTVRRARQDARHGALAAASVF